LEPSGWLCPGSRGRLFVSLGNGRLHATRDPRLLQRELTPRLTGHSRCSPTIRRRFPSSNLGPVLDGEVPMDLKKLLDRDPIARIQTSIGEFCLFWLSSRDQFDLHARAAEASPAQAPALVRELIRRVCFPKASLREGKYKPEAPTITAEQADQLTDDDLQHIAREYLENNQELYREDSESMTEDATGTRTVKIGLGEIVNPKAEGETDVAYLARLLVDDAKASEERHKKLMESVKKSFSSPLFDHVKQTQQFADQFRSAFAGIPLEQLSRFEIPDLPRFEMPEMPEPVVLPDQIDILRDQQRNFERPFSKLEKKLSALLDQSNKAAELTIRYGNIQTEIAAEIKAAADDNRRATSKNSRLTVLVIGLTIVGLLLAGMQVWLALSDGYVAQQATKRQADAIVVELKGIRTALDDENDKLRISIQELQSRASKREVEIAELTRRLNAQEKAVANSKAKH
jgi:hypothetical protein